jgi:hypothetical protein
VTSQAAARARSLARRACALAGLAGVAAGIGLAGPARAQSQPEEVPPEAQPEEVPTEAQPDEAQPEEVPPEAQPEEVPPEAQPDEAEAQPEEVPPEAQPEEVPAEAQPDEAEAQAEVQAEAQPRSQPPAPPQWSVAFDSGAELDTNIHRCESGRSDCAVQAAPLARTSARLGMGWQPYPGRRLQLVGFAGARWFAEELDRGENLAVVSGDARYLWDLPARNAALSVRGAYYDTFGYAAPAGAGETQRHFAVANAELHLTLAGGESHELTTLAGYRRFRYKPDADFDWGGEHYGARYRTTRWLDGSGDGGDGMAMASLELSVAYELERRGYQGHALRNTCGPGEMPGPLCLRDTGVRRSDLSHRGSAEAVYTGDRIYSARYQLEVIDSSSAGPYAQVRHRLELGVTSELFAGLFGTAEAALQVIGYRDALFLASGSDMTVPDPGSDFVAIDDENRNAFSLHLARDLGRAWSLEGRYALYTSALAARELGFQRQLFYLGVAYRHRP